MRREFILVILGIICISTLSSLLSGYVQIETDKVLLDTVVGAVGAGNFSYWQLGHTGPLLVELTSLSGDADLYVSDTVRFVPGKVLLKGTNIVLVSDVLKVLVVFIVDVSSLVMMKSVMKWRACIKSVVKVEEV